jgi:SWI/SNF-related matrix-associated actin-dependent regulator 1 of chromatin subfamily A
MWLVKPKKTQILQSVPTKLKNFKNHGYGINKDAEIYIINYDILKNFKEELKKIKWDVLILDEAHFCKSRSAIRTKIALSIKSKRKIFLTGTPIENRPIEIFTLLRSLDKPNWNNYLEFGTRYCNGFKTIYGWDFTGARRLDELQYKLRSTLMIRRKKVDVLKDLPPKFRQVIELPSDGLEYVIKREKTALERKQSAKNAVLSADMGTLSDNDEDYAKRVDELQGGVDNSFDELSKARKETAIAKIPLVVEHLRNCYEANSDKKIVLFAYHREVIETLMEECREWYPVKLYGGMSVEEKQESIDTFQKNSSCKLFIGNVRSAGVGITLTKSSHVVFAELDWNPAVITQCEDRAHRIGQTENVLIQHLVLEGSVDSQMIKVIIEKQKIADKMLDRDHFSIVKDL